MKQDCWDGVAEEGCGALGGRKEKDKSHDM